MTRSRYSRTRREHHGRKSRSVHYDVVVAEGDRMYDKITRRYRDNESRVEELLAAALAAGTITQWDGSRGFFWWEGPPGEAMRALRDAIGGEPVRWVEEDPIAAAARRVDNSAVARGRWG